LRSPLGKPKDWQSKEVNTPYLSALSPID